MPNRQVLQQQIAKTLFSAEEGEVVVAPPVYIFSAWIESLAARTRMLNGQEVPGKLDNWSGLLTWADQVAGKIDHAGRAFELAAARQARDADRLLRQWLRDEEIPWLDERFFAIRSAARRVFESQGLFSAEDWIQDLTEKLKNSGTASVPLPDQVDLVGFIEITAQESALLEALEAQGVMVNRTSSSSNRATVKVVEYPTPEEERQAAAAWAKSRLETGAQRLAIVLSDETTKRGGEVRRLRDLLSAVFHPVAAARLEDAAIQDFFVPDACTLGDSSAVADALLLLRLSLAGVDQKIEFSQLSHWLLSPHWSDSESESESRARLEIELRRKGFHELSLTEVRRLASSDKFGDTLPGLAQKVAGLAAFDDTPDPGNRFHQALNYWGWPGGCKNRTLAGEIDQFVNLLERLDSMHFDSPKQGLATLEMMTAGTRFAFGGGPLSPVQIVSPEVAASTTFDAVWVCGLDSANWPPPLSTNPYVPATARTRIPRMNPDGQHAYYRTLTDLLSHCGDEVLFSWSRDGGEGERSQSGLITGFVSSSGEVVTPTNLASAYWANDKTALDDTDYRLVVNPDASPGLPIPGVAAPGLPGGSGFFRLQAACPLLGYLRYRLAADFPEPPSALASPQFRGELLHQALRELYRQTVPTGIRPTADQIPENVEAALIRLRARERLTTSAFLAERQRLAALLNEWLSLDYSREGFVVEAIEEGRRLKCGSSEISIRFDRLDRMSDQTFFVLDYKSGGNNNRALKWKRPRVQEPQLPLYAVLLEDSGGVGLAGGIAFAIVKRGKCEFDGMSAANDGKPIRGIRPIGSGSLKDWDWPALMSHWRAQIAMLRDEILAGRADNTIYDQQIVEQSGLELILRYAEVVPDDDNGHDNAG